jgi:spermidine synthase
LRFGLGVAAILLLSTLYVNAEGQIVYAERSFFGVVRVAQGQQAGYHLLMHGSTLHGMQSRDPARATEPLSYYYRTGPLGQVFETFNAANTQANVGVVGLGTGAIACYATPAQHWTFFEIDPLVEAIARDPRYFTFLRDCGKGTHVVLGDARLSLEASTQQYNMLILDAYSSDSIPMHLVTREALKLYADRLAPHGMLLFHISNRHLDLEPVLGNLAHDAGLTALVRSDAASSEEQALGKASSQWVVMARSRADLAPLAADQRWQSLRTRSDQPVWTDTFGGLLSVFRW